MSDPSADLVGRTLLGKLRVLRRLGEGGMGAVYEVEHLLTRHRRALKVLKPEVAVDADVVARFVREAGVAGTVRNVHITETYDAGTLDEGQPYVLMELLDGAPLSKVVADRGKIPAAEAARIGMEICDGAAAAHDAGIVHRDLKPDNVFLARGTDGRVHVKLLDFGISKFAGEAAPLTTDTGMVMGTPHYMSPEQARATRDIDRRADVYAIGVILYEMIAGVRPFDAETFAALIVQIHTGEHRPLGQRMPGIDRGLAEIVERAMAVDRESRPRTARELAEQLGPFATESIERPSGAAMMMATRDSIGTAETMASAVPVPLDRKVPQTRGRAWRAPAAIGAGLAALGLIGIVLASSMGGVQTPPAPAPVADRTPEGPLPRGRDTPPDPPVDPVLPNVQQVLPVQVGATRDAGAGQVREPGENRAKLRKWQQDGLTGDPYGGTP